MLSLLYDVVRRIRLFVEDWTLLNHRGKPHLLGLWDQVSTTPNPIPNQLGLWDQVSDLVIAPRCYCVPRLTAYCSLVTYQLAHRLTDQLTNLLLVPGRLHRRNVLSATRPPPLPVLMAAGGRHSE